MIGTIIDSVKVSTETFLYMVTLREQQGKRSLHILACPPKIGPLEMRDSCRIRTGGSICENEKVFGGAGIQDSQRG